MIIQSNTCTFVYWFCSNQVKTNPDKFQAIAIGKFTQSKIFLKFKW